MPQLLQALSMVEDETLFPLSFSRAVTASDTLRPSSLSPSPVWKALERADSDACMIAEGFVSVRNMADMLRVLRLLM